MNHLIRDSVDVVVHLVVDTKLLSPSTCYLAQRLLDLLFSRIYNFFAAVALEEITDVP